MILASSILKYKCLYFPVLSAERWEPRVLQFWKVRFLHAFRWPGSGPLSIQQGSLDDSIASRRLLPVHGLCLLRCSIDTLLDSVGHAEVVNKVQQHSWSSRASHPKQNASLNIVRNTFLESWVCSKHPTHTAIYRFITCHYVFSNS